jgi:hypothetical protein
MHGTLAYIPVAMRKVMPYFACGEVMLPIAAYPAIAMGRENSMMTPLSFRRSERKDTNTVLLLEYAAQKTAKGIPVSTAATAYGITVQSCVWFASLAKPLSSMIVGSCERGYQ